MLNLAALAALTAALATPAAAHIALWHESMYGFRSWDKNTNHAVTPLRGLTKAGWFFHGDRNDPPAAGKFLNIPSGGTTNGLVACHKVWTPWGSDPNRAAGATYACDGTGALHTIDKFGTQPKDVKGCALAIAYNSNPQTVQPDDFVIISVNYECPWKRNVAFQIPAGLPPCPPGGCHCSWNWVHSPSGGGPEIYQNMYRCNVQNPGPARAMPKGKVARKCPYDIKNCTIGAKTPHIWLQAEGNNNFQDALDPPFYNWEYGFRNGAQNDIFTPDSGPKNTNQYAPPPLQTTTMVGLPPKAMRSAIPSPAPEVDGSASVPPAAVADNNIAPALDTGGSDTPAPETNPAPQANLAPPAANSPPRADKKRPGRWWRNRVELLQERRVLKEN